MCVANGQRKELARGDVNVTSDLVDGDGAREATRVRAALWRRGKEMHRGVIVPVEVHSAEETRLPDQRVNVVVLSSQEGVMQTKTVQLSLLLFPQVKGHFGLFKATVRAEALLVRHIHYVGADVCGW